MVAPMTHTYNAVAKRWEHGWELHVAGVGVTQVRTIDHAEQQVRDLVETMTGEDASAAVVNVQPDLNGLETEITLAREAVADAQRAQAEAAARSRRLAARLRAEGFSVTDTAALLGVSRGRVSQLVASP